MIRKRKLYTAALIFLFVTIGCFGYIDPGTGSYVIQVILAALVGVPLAVGIFWKKIKTFFGKLFSRDKKEEKEEREEK
jgi:hypothetical protein